MAISEPKHYLVRTETLWKPCNY